MTPTTHAQPQPRFPLLTAALCLTATAAAACVAAFGLLRFGMAHDHATALNAVYLAGVVAWGSAVVGLLPVAALGPLGVMPTVWAYFAGAALRLAACLGVYMLVATQGNTPTVPLAVALAMVYVPLLFVEAAIVGRYLWAKDFLPPQSQPQPTNLHTQGAVA